MSEMGSAPLPDARLNPRLISMLMQVARRPGDSILHGARTPAEAEGFYRFLENKRVEPDQLWQPMHQTTAKAMRGLRRVVVVQDSTALMFPRLKSTTGLGTADQEREEALWMHSALALHPKGHPLGLLYNHVWARPIEEFRKGHERKRRPFEEKESFEWVRGMRQVAALAEWAGAKTRILHVFDRAGDVHEVLQEVVTQEQDAVIRCCQRHRRVSDDSYATVQGAVAAQKPRLTRTVSVPRKPGRRARQAAVEVRSTTVTLSPAPIYPHRQPLTIHVVWVHEPAPPSGVEPLDWLLLTTLPVDTAKRCWKVVEAYQLRWRIEELHLTFKSGCKTEQTQLKTAGRIEVLLALHCSVAVRILQLTHLARTTPTALCTEVLSEDEWQVLCAYVHRRPVARAHGPPTIHEAVLMLGRLGGHLGRKSDGMPGVRSLWRGWRDLQLLVDGYRLVR